MNSFCVLDEFDDQGHIHLEKRNHVCIQIEILVIMFKLFLLQILVWHTQTAEPNMKQEIRLEKLGQQSDPSMEV